MLANRTLVTGGVRSGKSRIAESLLAGRPAVTYLAPGPVPDRATDPEWADRIDAHRARRPAHWHTVETTDIAAALGQAPGAVLIDCLGTWVTAVVDDLGTWDERLATWEPRFDAELDRLERAWRAAPARWSRSPTRWAGQWCPSTDPAARSGTCSAGPTSGSPRPVMTCCWWLPGACCACNGRLATFNLAGSIQQG